MKKVFGIGFGKTGTTSLALMFQTYYKSEHEPNKLPLISLILGKANHRTKEFRDMVKNIMDSFFTSELNDCNQVYMNSSQLNGLLIEELIEIYPEAKFILTIREPEDWLNSVVNHTVHTNIANNSIWADFRDYLFGSKEAYKNLENTKDPNKPYTINQYLDRWLYHNVSIINLFKQKNRLNQLLILKTDEMEEKIPEIAKFLEIPVNTIRPCHGNIGNYNIEYSSYIDPKILKIEAHKYIKLFEDMTGLFLNSL